MLTKMPKVGDVLIAEGRALAMGNMTLGREYVVDTVSTYGDASFTDDNGARRFVSNERFGFFTLKSDAEPVGFIIIKNIEAGESPTRQLWTLDVDVGGGNAINKLVKVSESQRKRTELQTKIDALQKEMDAI